VAQASAEGSDHVLAGERGRLRGQPVRAGEPVEHPRHRALAERLITVARSTGHLADELVGVAAALSRLGPPRAYKVSGASCALALRGGVDGPLHQPGRPRSALGLEPLDLDGDLLGRWENTRISPAGTPLSSRLPCWSAVVHATPRERVSTRW
jgi:hypothetical protein